MKQTPGSLTRIKNTKHITTGKGIRIDMRVYLYPEGHTTLQVGKGVEPDGVIAMGNNLGELIAQFANLVGHKQAALARDASKSASGKGASG